MANGNRQAAGPRLRLVAAPWTSLYDLPVDAVVEEQDRYRILGLDDTPVSAHESYPRLINAADHEAPAALGSVLQAGGRPLRLRAILIDIDRGTRVSTVHLRAVAERLCGLIETRRIRRLGMPILGAVHGNTPPAVFAAVFAPCVRETNLETFYLLAGSNPSAAVLRQLRSAFAAETG